MIERYSDSREAGGDSENWRHFLHKELRWPVKFAHVPARNFKPKAEYFSLGEVVLINHHTPPSVINREAAPATPGQDRYFSLNLLLRGDVTLWHYHRVHRLQPGDMVLADSASASTLTFDSASHILTARLPGALLAAHLPRPEHFCNHPLSSGENFGKALRELLHTLWHRGKLAEGGEALRTLSVKPLLELLTLAFLSESNGTISGRAIRLGEIKAFIMANIVNPALTPDLVAHEFGISSRYLRKLFARQDDSVTRYIQRCRLQICADHLSSESWQEFSITDICFHSGFNSSAHFTRSFKAHFGVTPKAYRRSLGEPLNKRNKSR